MVEIKKTSQDIKRDEQYSVPKSIAGSSNRDIANYLFSGENKLLTGFGGSIELPQDTQNLVAYFSGGELIISKTHRYDGRVLAFLSLLDREKKISKEPFYSELGLISEIYKFNEAKYGKSGSSSSSEFDNQMQKDFVDIVTRAAGLKVSDIHVVVADQTTIFFRIDGSLETVLEYNSSWGESFVRAVFASADISDSNYAQNEFQSAQKDAKTPLRGTKNLYLPQNILGIRMQFNPIAFGSRYLVMRLLYDNPSEGIQSNQEFGPYEQRQLYRMRSFPTGLVVVAGPTSSGKSTTLRQNMSLMLKEHDYEINLITVEDPAESKIYGAHQISVTNATTDEEKDLKFTEALAAALRSDPDALMVGEIRTLSAALLTVKGALSGHNVWTTLHANSALAALTRLLDIGVEAFKLKDETMMRGLVSMRLFKKVCPHCKEKLENHPEHPAYARALDAYGKIGLKQIYTKGTGCDKCDFKGSVGRIKAGELILTDGYFLNKVLTGEQTEATRYWLEDLNGRTLKEAASELMLKGIISIEELERWVGLLDQPSIY